MTVRQAFQNKIVIRRERERSRYAVKLWRRRRTGQNFSLILEIQTIDLCRRMDWPREM